MLNYKKKNNKTLNFYIIYSYLLIYLFIYLFKSQITITPIASPVTAILNARDKDIVVILFR